MKRGEKIINFEIARRSLGIRLIIIKNNKILLTKEFRYELNEYNFRLPGGKVFDTLAEYNEKLKKNSNILEHALKAAKKECLEETGLIPKNIKHFQTTKASATIKWDLFYFIIIEFEENNTRQTLEDGEIVHLEWKNIKKVKERCLNNKIKEYRSVGVLLSFLLKD